MNEHLFKLKRDDKTVGYCKWTDDWGFTYSLAPDFEEPFHHFAVAQTKGISAHPFVTKDKNGKDVFAGDKVKMLKKRDFLEGEICEVGWSKYGNGYWLTCNKGNTDHWYGGWVKLIEEKKDE